MADRKQGLFGRLRERLGKTRDSLMGGIRRVVAGRALDDSLFDDLEEILIQGDVGVETTLAIIDDLRQAAKEDRLENADALYDVLRKDLLNLLSPGDHAIEWAMPEGPHVTMVVGVNGSGKTTTIGKLAAQLGAADKTVILGAADTFRAAATEQLSIWGERVGAAVIKHQDGSDPAAVAFDAADAAVSRGADCLIVDTAGRLHTKVNLMEELKKIQRVVGKRIPGAPHQVLLVLDATTGQNGLQQARQFTEALNVTGLVLAKLDGTAKGGIVVAIQKQLDIPIKFIGIGEGIEDLQPFAPEAFVDALLT